MKLIDVLLLFVLILKTYGLRIRHKAQPNDNIQHRARPRSPTERECDRFLLESKVEAKLDNEYNHKQEQRMKSMDPLNPHQPLTLVLPGEFSRERSERNVNTPKKAVPIMDMDHTPHNFPCPDEFSREYSERNVNIAMANFWNG
eukprot:Platyproteum_vivax@DN529_c0_g1_i1.p1